MFALYFYSAPAAFAQCDANEVTLEIVFDNYSSETSWDIADDAGNILASGAYAAGTATATETACLSDGMYTLTMYDVYSDGMCCTYGEGSYSLTDAEGNILASGGSFGASESTSFAVGAVALAGCMDMTACNYNAAATEDDGSCAFEALSISLSSNYWSSETGYSISNNLGEVVASMYGSYTNGVDILEEACVVEGCYTMTVTDAFGDGMGSTGAWSVTWNGLSIVSGGFATGLSVSSDEWCFGPGCMDSAASNYSMTATSDDGTCQYVGCTDATACNFDPAATEDDGSCAFEAITITINPDNFATESSWDLVDADGGTVASGTSVGTELCLASACFTFTM
jgi:hypothetical protein